MSEFVSPTIQRFVIQLSLDVGVWFTLWIAAGFTVLVIQLGRRSFLSRAWSRLLWSLDALLYYLLYLRASAAIDWGQPDGFERSTIILLIYGWISVEILRTILASESARAMRQPPPLVSEVTDGPST